jgi:hypothetical protein
MGLILGGTTLGVIWWANDAHDTAVARTMGMTTFAIANGREWIICLLSALTIVAASELQKAVRRRRMAHGGKQGGAEQEVTSAVPAPT